MTEVYTENHRDILRYLVFDDGPNRIHIHAAAIIEPPKDNTLNCIGSFSLQKGLERVSKIMMIGLLALILILAVNSLTLDGALEGLKFYLLPDFGRAMEVGILNVITAAMKQAFFTLSIGMACMEIFGSYMSRDTTIGGEAVKICLLDTFVAKWGRPCYNRENFPRRPDYGSQKVIL